jgi:hypothetical protein
MSSERFLLHYYGPHRIGDRYTFRYVSVGKPLPRHWVRTPPRCVNLDPASFKDKIVLIGALHAGTFDVKASPLSSEYPGVEMHATAIENCLRDQRVHTARAWLNASISFLAALVAASRRAHSTARQPQAGRRDLCVVVIVVCAAVTLVRGDTISLAAVGDAALALLLATGRRLGVELRHGRPRAARRAQGAVAVRVARRRRSGSRRIPAAALLVASGAR